MARTTSTRLHRAWGVAVLPAAVALALTACGGGGGNVRATPPPATPPPPTGIGFTPTVANDASLVVTPPTVPTLAPPPGLDLAAYAATVLRRFANRPLYYCEACQV